MNIISGIKNITQRAIGLARSESKTAVSVKSLPPDHFESSKGIIKDICKDVWCPVPKSEIKRLDKISDKNEFVFESWKSLYKNSGLPDDLRPTLQILPREQGIAKQISMTYSPILHTIKIYNEAIESLSKPHIFSAIRHELQHAIQNINICRTEGLGGKAVQFYSKTSTDKYIEMYKSIALNGKSSEIKKLKPLISSENYKDLVRMKRAQSNHNVDKVVQNIYQLRVDETSQAFEEFRQNILTATSPILKDSKKAKLTAQYFKDFTESDVSKFSISKNILPLIELEAYTSMSIAYYKYLFNKFF